MEEHPLIQIKNLRIGFHTDAGAVQAVKGISFHVNKGETIGIVGESGSGKSVTSLAIMRLLAKNAIIEQGHIQYQGSSMSCDNLLELPESQMNAYRGKTMGMVFQEPMSSLNPVMKCGEQVAEAVRLHLKLNRSNAKKRVLELFSKVQLPDPERAYEAYPHQLSGGQKQRVMIAMAISCDPELLIADEPTTALDVTVQQSILDLINGLQAETQSSVIFISHDLGVIAEVADRVIVMYGGEIVEEGSVATIFKNPQHNYTKSLLACRPPLEHRVHRLPTVKDFLNDSADFKTRIVKPAELQERQQFLDTQSNILEVEHLKVWFPGKKNWYGKVLTEIKAVDDVSFKLRKGETLGLVGESGCGKSTLSRAILRLNPVRSGKIIFEGQNILDLDRAALRNWRRRFQIIFQDPAAALNPRMSIGPAIMEPMTVHGLHSSKQERYEKTIALLEKVGMNGDHFNRYPHEFSGGQKQRICIARALALEPTFLICDESVSALDVSVQAQVLNLLMDLREEFELSYIFISHDLSVVKLMSDRMLVMNEGQIVERGFSEKVYHHPKEKYTQDLISAIPKGII